MLKPNFLHSKTVYPLAAIALIIYAFVGILGLQMSMSMNAKGDMVHCPFMQGTMSLCPMNAAEHVNEWNAAFSAIPQNHLMQLLLGSIGLILAAFILNNFFFTFRNIFAVRYKRYQADHPDIPLFNYFALVLARGILQPKLYA